MNTPLFRTLCLLGFLIAALPVQAQSYSSGWLGSNDYQRYFDTAVVPGGLLPVAVEAGLYNGHLRFHGTFVTAPPGIAWATHHGLSDANFAAHNLRYMSQGYRLVYHQRFDTEGIIANQAIWTR